MILTEEQKKSLGKAVIVPNKKREERIQRLRDRQADNFDFLFNNR